MLLSAPSKAQDGGEPAGREWFDKTGYSNKALLLDGQGKAFRLTDSLPDKPVFLASGSTIPFAVLSESIEWADARTSVPENLDDLTDGWDTWGMRLTREAAIKLNFFAEAELSANDQVMVYYLAYYRADRDEQGREIRRWGAGMQLKLRVSGIDAKAELSLPLIAASSTLKVARAEARLTTFGLSGPKIEAAKPSANAIVGFGVDGYAALLQAADKLSAAARDPSTVVTPVTLFIDVPATDEAESAASLARTYALVALRDGLSVADARKRVPEVFANRSARAAFEDQYFTLSGSRSTSAAPSEVARARARALLEASGLQAIHLKP